MPLQFSAFGSTITAYVFETMPSTGSIFVSTDGSNNGPSSVPAELDGDEWHVGSLQQGALGLGGVAVLVLMRYRFCLLPQDVEQPSLASLSIFTCVETNMCGR